MRPKLDMIVLYCRLIGEGLVMCHFSCSDTVRQLSFTWLFCLLAAAGCGNFVCAEDGKVPPPEAYSVPETVAEARSRAYLLHELIHDTLHVVHRDFFDADESVSIPSHSFEDVFEGLELSLIHI